MNHKKMQTNNRKDTRTICLQKVFCLLLLVLSGCSFALFAAESESKGENNELNLKQLLLMPGKLTRFHVKEESNCDACHVDFEKANQTKLCLDCHKQINKDIRSQSGYHGKIEKGLTDNCKQCHTDHKGRDFDIRSLDKQHFEHQLTNFELKGKHQLVDCRSCHKEDKRDFRIEKRQCVDCHEDFHQGELGDKCESCHSEKGWRVSGFDHDKTDFSLDGAHQPLQCNQCHFGGELKKIPTKCESCHAASDPHFGLMEKSCDTCHKTSDWKKTSFRHNKDTDFRLKGKHEKVACQSCHFKTLKPKKTCYACHKQDDIHAGANGQKCESCHNEQRWKTVKFDHDMDTKFPLTGSHEKVECDACHFEERPEAKLGLVRACVDCHRPQDPHLGKLGDECEKCHATSKWNTDISFSHEFTDFPLTAAHRHLICESCHADKAFTEQGSACVDCHRDDDPHEKSFGENCADCHNTAAFSSWQFDHDTQTKFPLLGSHIKVECKACHQPGIPISQDIVRACVQCHRDDDVHQGTFGQDCAQCHNEKSFADFEY